MNTPPTATDNQGTSTRPYLIRALHDWCTDNGFTPYIAVQVDAGVRDARERASHCDARLRPIQMRE